MGHYPCPKCGAHFTRLVWEDDCLLQTCICGLRLYLFHQSPEGITIMRRAVVAADIRIPATGTKRHRCVLALLNSHPLPLCTTQLAEVCGLFPKEASAIMVMMMTLGIVERIEYRKGFSGGSVWGLSHEAKALLKVHIHE